MIADSTEAIRALSGDQISREEAALLWQEIRNRKEAGGKTAAEVAETLGYQIETSDLQALDNDLLTSVAGGLAARNIEKSISATCSPMKSAAISTMDFWKIC